MRSWILPALLASCPGCILIESAQDVIFGDPKLEAVQHWKSMHEKVSQNEILVTSVSTDYPQNGFVRLADLNNAAITTYYEISERSSQKESGKLTAERMAQLRKLTAELPTPPPTKGKASTEVLVSYWVGPERKTMRYDGSQLPPAVQKLCDRMKAETGMSDDDLHQAAGP